MKDWKQPFSIPDLKSLRHWPVEATMHLRLICGLFTGITMALGFLNNNKPLGAAAAAWLTLATGDPPKSRPPHNKVLGGGKVKMDDGG